MWRSVQLQRWGGGREIKKEGNTNLLSSVDKKKRKISLAHTKGEKKREGARRGKKREDTPIFNYTQKGGFFWGRRS